MLPQRIRTGTEAGDRKLMAALAGLVLFLLVAFWFVCQQQVRNAETRHSSSRVERVAMDECLRHVQGATPIRCADRIDSQRGASR